MIAMPRWNDIAATHNKNDSRVRWKIDGTVCFFRQADVPGFVCSCACSLMSPSFNPWTSPALTDAMPWVHRGLSSGPCKPRRPLFTLQPNGYAKLPFMCHRHDRHKRPRLLSSRRRTQAFCSGTRQLAWLLSLCSRRENRPPRLLPPLRKVSYHSERPVALRWAMAACITRHVFTPRQSTSAAYAPSSVCSLCMSGEGEQRQI